MDGWPFNHGVSLAHSWSTWPVFLMPRYLAGVCLRAPGWRVIGIEPVIAGLDYVECSLDSVVGRMQISVTLEADRFER